MRAVAVVGLCAVAPIAAQGEPDEPGPPVAAGQATPADPFTLLSAFNPRVTVIGDLVFTGVDGTLRDANGEDVGDRFALRETEVDLRADIDAHVDGVFIVTLEELAPGEYRTEIDEGFFALSASGLRAKGGRFRTSLGVANTLHTHDLPHSDRPLVVRSFLGEDGDSADGLALSYTVPRSGDRPTATLGYQIVNGENPVLLAGRQSDHVAHIVRITGGLAPAAESTLDVGASVLIGRAQASGTRDTVLVGADVTYRWRPEERTRESSLLAQFEAFHLQRELTSETIHSDGAYGMLQYQAGRHWYLSARGDWTEFADVDRGEAWAASAWLSYHTSAAFRVRFGVERLEDPRQDIDWLVFVQGTFAIGAPPERPYWANH